MIEDEDLLTEVINSAPILDGVATDLLDGSRGYDLATRFGGTGTDAEIRLLRRARTAVHAMVRGQNDGPPLMAEALARTVLAPTVSPAGIEWQIDAPPDEHLAARTLLAWSRVERELPGRLRACANTECALFLIDHSRPGSAKWCSMATCGNRMKVRAHAHRQRQSAG